MSALKGFSHLADGSDAVPLYMLTGYASLAAGLVERVRWSRLRGTGQLVSIAEHGIFLARGILVCSKNCHLAKHGSEMGVLNAC